MATVHVQGKTGKDATHGDSCTGLGRLRHEDPHGFEVRD